MHVKSFIFGAKLAILARILLPRLLKAKFSRDLERLNAGDSGPLLAGYADDAVLRFNDGEHRFAGEWAGKAQLERFFANFVATGLQGEIETVAVSGPPWALTMWARLNTRVEEPDGTRLYENRLVVVIRTRWGKIVDHEDFYIDTDRLAALDRAVSERGVAPVPKTG